MPNTKYLGDPTTADWVSSGNPLEFNNSVLLTMAEGSSIGSRYSDAGRGTMRRNERLAEPVIEGMDRHQALQGRPLGRDLRQLAHVDIGAQPAIIRQPRQPVLANLLVEWRLDQRGLVAREHRRGKPTAHGLAVENVMREDEARPSWLDAAVLANAPRRHENQFAVQAIFD